MPKLNGYQVFTEIKKIDSAKRIIALTAKAYESEKNKIIDYGFDSYISKPVDESTLFKCIEDNLIK